MNNKNKNAHILYMCIFVLELKRSEIMRKNKKENTTQYGEFISSYFSWITPEAQKKRGEELENISKNKIGQNEIDKDKN